MLPEKPFRRQENARASMPTDARRGKAKRPAAALTCDNRPRICPWQLRPCGLCLPRSDPSERDEVPLAGEFHVTGIDAEAQAQPHAHRDQHHIAAAQIAGVEPADQIGRALTRAEALVQVLGVVEIVDQHEGIAGIGPGIETDRRAGPVNGPVAFHLVVQRARSIAQTDDERARSLAPAYIAVGLAPLAPDVLYQTGL